MSRFLYLVCSGGGIGLCTYAGAFKELSNYMNISELKGIAGSSAGAIAALGLSLRFSPNELEKKLMALDFSKVCNKGFFGKFVNFFFHYGKYDGKYIIQSIGNLIRDKIQKEIHEGRLSKYHALASKNPLEITFTDLHTLGCIDLHVIATKLYKINGVPVSKEKDFSYETTPDASVALAVRASCAASPVIAPIRLKKIKTPNPDGSIPKGKYEERFDGDLFVDGGWRDNCPAEVFDKIRFLNYQDASPDQKIINYNTLLLNLDFTNNNQVTNGEKVKTTISDASWREFIAASTHAFYKGYVQKAREGDSERRVNINIGDFNSFDLHIKPEDKLKLIKVGAEAVKRHFELLRARYELVDGEQGVYRYEFKTG